MKYLIFGRRTGLRVSELAFAAAGNQAHRSPTPRSQRPGTRSRREFRFPSTLIRAGRSFMSSKALSSMGRGQRAGDPQGGRRLVYLGGKNPCGEERRQWRRVGTRHLRRRKRETAGGVRQV